MKTFLKNEWLQLLILIAPFIAVALLWNQIPDRVPSHWNARGQINGYSGKAVGTLLMPCINIFVALLIAVLPRIDPKLAKRDPESRANTLHTVRIMRLAITTFESLFALAIIFIAAKVFPHGLDFNSIVYIGLGGLLIVMGNFMTKPSISHHLDLLKQADLIFSEKNGQFIIYSLNTSVLDECLSWLMSLTKKEKTPK
jgi:DNA-binding transcriptional ArsR family regulator